MINPESAIPNFKELEPIARRVEELKYKVERKLQEAGRIVATENAS